jgi:hypothetical protein
MRPTFIVLSNGELVSAIRKKGEQHALRVGLRLELAYPYETDYGIVPAGARGLIKAVDEEDGTVWILMEGMEPALFHWDNMLVISPHQTDDLVACIRLSIDKRLPREEHRNHGTFN